MVLMCVYMSKSDEKQCLYREELSTLLALSTTALFKTQLAFSQL